MRRDTCILVYDLYIKDIILFWERKHSEKGSVSEGTMNFIQLLSRIKQSLKAKTGRGRIFIARSVTNSSNLSELPFYEGKLSENFGKRSTNAQKIGSCVLQTGFPENRLQTFASFRRKQSETQQKHKPDRS